MKELNVKVGDKLLYSYGYSYNITERIVEVTKVTPTGKIRVTTSDSQYDKYGHEIGNHNILNCKSKLSILTEEDIERITQNNAIAKALNIVSKLHRDNLEYEKALKIIELFEERIDKNESDCYYKGKTFRK